MTNEQQKYIEDNIYLIENNSWEEFFSGAPEGVGGVLYTANIEFMKDLISIPMEAFRSCSELTEIVIPDNIQRIGHGAFRDCDNLIRVAVPDSVTSIGNSAFQDCKSLTDIVIPASVTTIGAYAFGYCPIETATIPTIAIPHISTVNLKTVIIRGGERIDYSAFHSCRSLTSVEIGDSVKIIDSCAFSNCSGLTSVDIPDSVKSIGNGAFHDCTSLTSIVLPESIRINELAFRNCPNLQTIKYKGTIKQWKKSRKSTIFDKNNITIDCIDGTV